MINKAIKLFSGLSRNLLLLAVPLAAIFGFLIGLKFKPTIPNNSKQLYDIADEEIIKKFIQLAELPTDYICPTVQDVARELRETGQLTDNKYFSVELISGVIHFATWYYNHYVFYADKYADHMISCMLPIKDTEAASRLKEIANSYRDPLGKIFCYPIHSLCIKVATYYFNTQNPDLKDAITYAQQEIQNKAPLRKLAVIAPA